MAANQISFSDHVPSEVEIKSVHPLRDSAGDFMTFHFRLRFRSNDVTDETGPLVTIDGALALDRDTSFRACERAILEYAAALLRRAATFSPADLEQGLEMSRDRDAKTLAIAFDDSSLD